MDLGGGVDKVLVKKMCGDHLQTMTMVLTCEMIKVPRKSWCHKYILRKYGVGKLH
jgi:hypothetical protein